MSKKRIIVTCPETDVAVITTIAYEEMVKQRKTPMLFSCPCGATHSLLFAGCHSGLRRQTPAPLDHHGVR